MFEKIAPFTSKNAAYLSLVEHINKAVEAVNQTNAVTGALDGGVLATKTHAGISFALTQAEHPDVSFWGIIAAGGSYTDNRYLINVAYLKQSSSITDTSAADLEAEDSTALSGTVTVTNVAEQQTGSHLLQVGQRVQVHVVAGRSTSGTCVINQLIICAYPAKMFPVLVKQNGGADGNALYPATWSYDLYNMSDTSLTTPIQGASTLQPLRSAARVVNCQVTPAPNGSVGVAYLDASGTILLWDCQELNPQTNCS